MNIINESPKINTAQLNGQNKKLNSYNDTEKKQNTLILVFSSSLPRYNNDNSGSFIPPFYQDLNNLRSRKYKIIFIGFRDCKCYKKEFAHSIFLPYFFHPKWENIAHGGNKKYLDKIYIPHIALLLFIKTIFLHISAKYYLRKIIIRLKRNYHVILWNHFAYPASYIGTIAAKKEKIHSISTFHSSGLHLLHIIPYLGNYFLKKIIRYNSAIQISSDYLLKKLPIQPDKIFSAPASIPSIGSIPSTASIVSVSTIKAINKTEVMFIGSFHRVKGIGDFLRKILDLPDDEFQKIAKQVKLQIIGSGSQKKSIEFLIKKIQARKNTSSQNFEIFYMPNFVAKDKIVLQIKKADYLLFPSRNYLSFTEGMPITALEAIANNKPILATKCGGLPELFIEGNPGVIYNNIDEMVHCLLAIPHNNSSTYMQMQKDCAKSYAFIKKRYEDFLYKAESIINSL